MPHMNLKNRYRLIGAIFALVYILGWILLNDAILISRDEMWYTHYSEELMTSPNDSQSDVRHTLDNDLHQMAFLPAFRLLNHASLTLTPNHLLGLRSLNLFFSIVLVVTLWFLLAQSLKGCVILLGILMAFSFDLHWSYLSHQMRPDWPYITMSLLALIFLTFFVRHKRVGFLYAAMFFSAFSASLYWNGLATVLGVGSMTMSLWMSREVSLKLFLKSQGLHTIFLFVLLGIPSLIYWNEFVSVFSHSAVHASELSDHIAKAGWLPNAFQSIKEGFLTSNYGQMLFVVFLTAISIALFMSYQDRRGQKTSRALLIPLVLFIAVVFVVLNFRSGGARTLYFLNPFIYFLMAIVLLQASGRVKHIARLVSLGAVLAFTFVGARHFSGTFGQWEDYQSLGQGLEKHLQSKDRVLTVFDFHWAIKNQRKFFLESIVFDPPRNETEIAERLERFDVDAVVIDEVTKGRMENPRRSQDYWYPWLATAIERNFEKIAEIQNPKYRPTKDRNQRVFTTEIWHRTRASGR